MNPKALALMGAASFYGGVHHKRYSGQQEIAPENYPSTSLRMTIRTLSCLKQNYHFF
ncbi:MULTISPECIES: hypothetical protein [Flavobacterium]|jgi:hypothetical protein|uniref:hypothetical protein n=1 Tax=Flavobacterium TaxID=237 RepID=UPI0013147E63|nr:MULTISPECIES: hypothetical protein [Flavobacterium]MCA1918839.1 hypothetical protein [Flavobacterium piscis]